MCMIRIIPAAHVTPKQGDLRKHPFQIDIISLEGKRWKIMGSMSLIMKCFV